MVATFETEVTKLVDFDVSMVWNHNQNPRPDADDNVPEQNDITLIVSLGLNFSSLRRAARPSPRPSGRRSAVQRRR